MQNRNTINSFLPPANKIPPQPDEKYTRSEYDPHIKSSPAIDELKSYGVDTVNMNQADAQRYLPTERAAYQRKIDKVNGYKLVDSQIATRHLMADEMIRQNNNGMIIKFG